MGVGMGIGQPCFSRLSGIVGGDGMDSGRLTGGPVLRRLVLLLLLSKGDPRKHEEEQEGGGLGLSVVVVEGGFEGGVQVG